MRSFFQAVFFVAGLALAYASVKEARSYIPYQQPSPYVIYPGAYYNYPYAPSYQNGIGDMWRLNFGLFSAVFRPTVTTTTVSTATVTCTVSTDACVRKRFLTADDVEEDAYIAPTAVANRIEPTAEATLQSVRGERQVSFLSQPFHEVHSTFDGSSYMRPAIQPHYYNPYLRLPAGVDERFFIITSTSTVTSFTVTTSTSRPSCSKASGFAQCP